MGDQFIHMFSYGPSEEPEEQPPFEQPAWLGPPDGELGVCVPLSLVVGRSEQAVVAIRHATAYSTGVTFDFLAAAWGLKQRETNRLFHEQDALGDPDDVPQGLLRIGVELADGSRISNLGNPHRALWRPDQEPEGPLFVPQGGGGGSGGAGRISLNRGYWLWPLPPPDALRVFVEWPLLGIALSYVELDSGPIADAALRSHQIWSPD